MDQKLLGQALGEFAIDLAPEPIDPPYPPFKPRGIPCQVEMDHLPALAVEV